MSKNHYGSEGTMAVEGKAIKTHALFLNKGKGIDVQAITLPSPKEGDFFHLNASKEGGMTRTFRVIKELPSDFGMKEILQKVFFMDPDDLDNKGGDLDRALIELLQFTTLGPKLPLVAIGSLEDGDVSRWLLLPHSYNIYMREVVMRVSES